MQAVRGARVATAHGERRGWWVAFHDGVIVEVSENPPASAVQRDLGAVDLIPGLVDLHSDCIERHLRPRPDALEPVAAAVLYADAEAAAHGVTTSFLCAAFEEDDTRERSNRGAAELVRTLDAWRPHLRADHRAHLRAELADVEIEILSATAGYGVVGLISYMDHTPGQGMWEDVDEWRAMRRRNYDATDEHLADAERRMASATPAVAERRAAVVALARSVGVPLAAHDVEGDAMIAAAVRDGVAIAEFPLSGGAAKRSVEAGMGVVLGAPNARRGSSRLERLSARSAIADGTVDALTSDYHVPSMLGAVYRLEADRVCSWSEAVALVTSGPARMGGLPDRGVLAPGQRADLVAVSVRDELPTARAVWVGGRPVWG